MFDETLLPFLTKLSPTIMWIALTVGFLLFIVGYFAGGNLAMGRIGMCILLVTIISVLTLPAPMWMFSAAKRQINVKTVYKKISEDTTKITGKQTAGNVSAKTTTGAAITAEAQNNGEEEGNAPFTLQLVAFFMYILWSMFLIGMGIFLYETLTVTAKEAERH
jgi:hypothetical protein